MLLRPSPLRRVAPAPRAPPPRRGASPAPRPHVTARRPVLPPPAAASTPAATTSDPVAALPVPLARGGGGGGVICLRGTCERTARVEVEYARKRGSTDNTYLVVGEGKGGAPVAAGDAILIDVPDEIYSPSHIDAIRRSAPGAALPTALVVTHLTPRRLPSLRALLAARAASPADAARPLDIYLSTLALRLLRGDIGPAAGDAALMTGVTLHAVKPGATVTRGGRTLALVPAPTPRWPDLVLAHDAAGGGTLFTSKLFSAHVNVAGGGPGAVTDAGDGGGGVAAFRDDWRHFFDCTLAPVARQAAALLARLDIRAADGGGGGGGSAPSSGGGWGWLRALDARLAAAQRATFGAAAAAAAAAPAAAAPLTVSTICPIHGPTVTGATAAALASLYRAWCADAAAAADALSVAVLYASAYGNTAALAQGIARGATRAGVGVEAVNLETAPLADVEAALARASGFALGSPTLAGHLPTQVVTALGSIIRAPASQRGAPCGVFGSYGWSGEAVADLATRLADAGFRFAFDPLRVQFRPTGDDMAAAEEAGAALAAAVRARAARKAAAVAAGGAAAAAATGAQAAVGRVVGSLCVVTTAAPDAARTAMLASWVSQASFDPPGLTLAVAKGRAAEAGLTAPGARFSISLVADGKDGPVSRALAKPGAGGDRLAGLDAAPDPDTGAPVLGAGVAAAWLACTTVSGMEAGDHVVLYASVDGGRVAPGGPQSAVRLRKSGATY